MSQNEIVASDILLEFLEVTFNHIIYFRDLYPKEIFRKKRIYGTVVRISIHPELNEYLTNTLSAIKELIKEDKNSIKAINLVFYNRDKVPLEKFVFDILDLKTNLVEKDPYYLKTEEILRTICLKLSICNTYLKPLPKGATFAIEIQTYETAHIALNENPECEDFPWIINDSVEMLNKQLLPLKTLKTDCLSLQLYVLENQEDKIYSH